MKNILIIGASGHARVIIDIIEKQKEYNIIGLISKDTSLHQDKVLGYHVLGSSIDIPSLVIKHDIAGIIIAIGDNYIRSVVKKNILSIAPNINFITAVHPRAYIAKQVSIGEGTVIMAGAIINSNCNIGNHCIINTNASLDHDSFMRDYSSLAPGCVTGGSVKIGEFTAIGIGSTIIHNINIGEHSVIGAGSLVLKDISSQKLCYGSPISLIKNRKIGDPYLYSRPKTSYQ